MQLDISTPERLLVQEDVTEVQVPGANGYLGILPQHAPLLSELGCGNMWYVTVAGAKRVLSVCNGFLEVQPDHVRILADRAENADEIDVARAQRALDRANERLLHPTADVDIARALAAFHRAQARLDAAKTR
jgi:F-type H+-transporting ATPase subunit epsilon